MYGYLLPRWPTPPGVRAVITTRRGGFSARPYDTFNLGSHVGDAPGAVARNREKLVTDRKLPGEPHWLTQVHGTEVAGLDLSSPIGCEADAALATAGGKVCTILTADCLPVLFCNRAGSLVAAAHAGWRGLAAGILRHTVAAMGESPASLLAYLGPAISSAHFEVGPEVKETFIAQALNASHARGMEHCFSPGGKQTLMADLYGLARLELEALGILEIYGGEYCTFGQPDLFYSYRRDGHTGRMASLIWLER